MSNNKMPSKTVVVSICIPTMNRAKYLANTLEKLLEASKHSDEFETIISDNSDTNETEEICSNYLSKGLNIVYYKNSKKGFYNSVVALTKANGIFLKLHNDYSVLNVSGVLEIISIAKKWQDERPLISFNNSGKLIKKINEPLDSVDYFYKLGHIATWSSAFSCWNYDIEHYKKNENDIYGLESQFPHTDILLKLIEGRQGIIVNSKLWQDQEIEGKSGYNIFKIFSEIYIDMLADFFVKHPNFYSKVRFFVFKKKFLLLFLSRWYALTIVSKKYSVNYKFETSNIRQHFNKNFSSLDWIMMQVASGIYNIYFNLKK
jgi:abequosyltransferase